LGREGGSVAVNFLDDARPAEAVVDEIERGGGHAFAVKADVAVSSEVRAMFGATVETFGRLDIVVNNAAWAFTKAIADVREDEFDRIFAVNVKGVFVGCQEAARRIADGGRLINVSSATTGLTLPGYGVYDTNFTHNIPTRHRLDTQPCGQRNRPWSKHAPGAHERDQYDQGK
jgi:3-oxoacyl-[acyl-carrier protein] reductase